METLIRHESPAEYFKEMVEAALEHQRVQAAPPTSWYLVNLLAEVALGGGPAARSEDQPLGLQFIEALVGRGSARSARLRDVADRSLFISGFFSDSLKRSLADVDYYMRLGAYAYRSLGEEEDEVLRPVFVELGRKFVSFADVLAEVSERSALMSNNDLLRLYEKWLRTGSRRDAELLAERGIVPNASLGDKVVH